MTRRDGAVWLVVLLLGSLVAAPGLVAGDAEGTPALEATIAENRVVPGEETTLSVTLTNGARLTEVSTTNPSLNERVLTASGVSVGLGASDAPLSVTTARQGVGSIPGGGQVSVPVAVSVAEGASAGTYRLPVAVEYTLLSSITEPTGSVNERRVKRTLYVTVRVVEQARFAVVDSEADVDPGGVGSVTVTLENAGPEAATDTAVTLESLDSGLAVGDAASATRFAGDWAPGEHRSLTYVVGAGDDAREAAYPVRVTAAFDDDRAVRRTDDAGVLGVEPRADRRFVVTDVTGAVAAGDAGTVAVAVRNEGPATDEATVSLRSSGPLAVDDGTAGQRFAGTWAAGVEREFRFDVAAPAGTAGGVHELHAAVDYRTEEGVSGATGPTTVGVPVAGDRRFAVRADDTSLTVGEAGVVRGTVVNEGPGPVDDAVVVLTPTSPAISLPETTYAVGDLGAGDSAEFALDATVAPTAEAGPRAFDVTVRWATSAGQPRESDPIHLRSDVAPQPDRLAFEALNATYASDSTNRLAVRVTNEGDTALSDLELGLRPAPPFTSESPTAYVPALDPGEATVVAFELEVADDAVESTHAVALNASAETDDGRDVRTGRELVAVTVAEPAGPSGDLALVGAAAVFVAVVLGAGWWWLRR